MKKIVISVMLLSLCGCRAVKEMTGDYVTDSVKLAIDRRIEDKLNEKGLSQKELLAIIDQNNDKSVSIEETIETAKDVAKDYLSLEGQRIFEEKLNSVSQNLVSKTQLDSKYQEILTILIGSLGTALAGYLTKQVISAKNDGKRDARIAVLEKVLNKDLDGDGMIGQVKVKKP